MRYGGRLLGGGGARERGHAALNPVYPTTGVSAHDAVAAEAKRAAVKAAARNKHPPNFGQDDHKRMNPGDLLTFGYGLG